MSVVANQRYIAKIGGVHSSGARVAMAGCNSGILGNHVTALLGIKGGTGERVTAGETATGFSARKFIGVVAKNVHASDSKRVVLGAPCPGCGQITGCPCELMPVGPLTVTASNACLFTSVEMQPTGGDCSGAWLYYEPCLLVQMTCNGGDLNLVLSDNTVGDGCAGTCLMAVTPATSISCNPFQAVFTVPFVIPPGCCFLGGDTFTVTE